MLALGAGVAWGFLGAIVLSSVLALLEPATHTKSEDLLISRDGTPFIQATNNDDNFNHITFRALDGTPYETPPRAAGWNARLSGPLSFPQRDQGTVWASRCTLIGTTRDGESWYFVHDGELPGCGYLVGYNVDTRLRVGYIGRDGFRPDEPPTDDCFSVDARRVWERTLTISPSVRPKPGQDENMPSGGTPVGVFYLVVDDGLVLVNLNDRTARVISTDAGFVSAADMGWMIAVRTADRIRLLEPDGKEIRSYPLSVEIRRNDPIRIWELPKNEVVISLGGDWQPKHDLFWLDAAGKITRRERAELSTAGQPRWISPVVANCMGSLLAMPSPGAVLSIMGLDAWERGYWGRLRKLWPEWWPGLLGTVLISAVLAVLCYRRQRQYDLPWTRMWVGFVLLFGVPAYIGYLVHRHWPARLACPHCGRPAPRDREACFACGQEFPVPAPKGIEVFA